MSSIKIWAKDKSSVYHWLFNYSSTISKYKKIDLIDKSIKKIFPMFSLANLDVFCKYKLILMVATQTHSKKVRTEGK